MKSVRTPARGDSPSDADVEQSTRRRVLRVALARGPVTAATLADSLGLTVPAVRRHLVALCADGLLEAREERVRGERGRGRPAKVFAVTDRGRRDFEEGYDSLALAAIENLVEVGGEAALEAVARARVEPVVRRFDELRTDRPDDSPARLLADALTDTGHVASTRPAPAGEQICQHACPVASVAERFPHLCETETRVFAELLGGHVQRLATIAHGDGVCTTHVPLTVLPSAAPAGPSDPETTQTPQTEPATRKAER